MSTKEKIIKEALVLFSIKGYSDVYVSDIAKAVGIKAPSLYKHFKSKKEIFEAIIDKLKSSYMEQTAILNINGTNAELDSDIYSNITEASLVEIGKGLFLYFLHDEYMQLFRKMLTLEQFHSNELSELYTANYFDNPLKYQENLFLLLISNGRLKNEKAEIMALQFYSPIYTLLTLCDRHPEREKEALIMLENHIKQFNRIYTKENLQ